MADGNGNGNGGPAPAGLPVRENQDQIQKSQQAAEYFKKASALTKAATATRKEVEESIEFLNAAIRLKPTNGRYYATRANAFRMLGEHQRAFFDYSVAVKLDEHNALYFCNRGVCLRKLSRFREALADFSTALDIDPDNGTYYFNRGLCLFEMSEYAAAVKDFTKTIELGKQLYRAHFNRGNCYRKLGRMEEAIKDLRECVSIDSRAATGHNNLGLALCEVGKYDEAVQAFNGAIERQDKCGAFLNNRALALYHLGKLDEAIRDLNSAIAADPDDASAYFHRGNALLAAEKPEEALADLRTAYSITKSHRRRVSARAVSSPTPGDPDAPLGGGGDGKDSEAVVDQVDTMVQDLDQEEESKANDVVAARQQHSIGLCYQLMDKPRQALEHFLTALREDGSHIPSRYHAAIMYHELGEYQACIQQLSQVLEAAGEERRVLEARGRAYQACGQHLLAVADFEAALRLEPARGELYPALAASLLALSRPSACCELLDRALSFGWDKPDVYYVRGNAFMSLGRTEDALTDYSIAVGMDAQRADYWEHRAICFMALGSPAMAEKDLDVALECGGPPFRIHALRGDARYEQDQFEAAVEDYRAAIASAKNSDSTHSIYYRIGISHANAGDHEAAVIAFTFAIDNATGEGNAVTSKLVCKYLHERAKSYQVCRRLQESLADFNAVLSVFPNTPHALFRRAFAFKALKRFEDAAADFESARRLQPDNPHLVVNYSKLHGIDVIVLVAAGEEPEF